MEKPEVYGRYLLIDRVSVGGMAEVFKSLAVGLSGFQKVLAIKRVLPNISEDDSFVQMFVDEANIAGMLHHTNIAQIYDLGCIDDTYFIAMEYVEGQDLRAIFDKVKKSKIVLPIELSAFTCSQILSALDYAHRKKDDQKIPLKIVHRDVSPPNIILSYDGDIKLVDFGIAKAAKKAAKTQAGVLKGKFGYMSPEQIRGMEIDGRSDVFSIGIVLFEMLAQRRLFVGETDFATLEKVRGMTVEKPSKYRKDIPEELDRIVLKALQRDISKRYQSAEEMQHDLQRFLYSKTPVFSERSLSRWIQEVFSSEREQAVERMNDLEKLDLNFFGIDLSLVAQNEMQSLKVDPNKDKTSKSTEQKSGELRSQNSRASDMADPALAPSIWPKTILLLALLMMFSTAGWYLLDKMESNIISVGNHGYSGEVTFFANQPDTDVIINNQTLCKTPCRIRDFWSGKHQVTFSKSGFISDVREFEVLDKRKKTLTGKVFKIGSVPTALVLRTNPPDTSITINGKLYEQTTPDAIKDLMSGMEYTVELTSPGFKNYKQKIKLDNKKFQHKTIIMQPETPSIRIESTPDGADVFLDGVYTKQKTPCRLDKLEDGKSYNLRISQKGYKTIQLKVTPSEKQEHLIELELEPFIASAKKKTTKKNLDNLSYGWLNIFTDPNTKIYIDGRFSGRYSPALNIKLAKGNHEIKLINEEFGVNHIANIKINGGQTFKIHKKF